MYTRCTPDSRVDIQTKSFTYVFVIFANDHATVAYRGIHLVSIMQEMAILAGGISASSIHDYSTTENGGGFGANHATEEGVGVATEGGGDTSETSPPGENGAEGGVSAAGGGSEEGGGEHGEASAGEGGAGGERLQQRRSAADGGEMWMEAPVVVKKYNKVFVVKKRRLCGGRGIWDRCTVIRVCVRMGCCI